MGIPPSLGSQKDFLPFRTHRKLVVFLFRLLLSIILTVILSQFSFDFFEAYFYDLRVKSKPITSTSKQIEIISIDNETLQTLKKMPGFKEHADLVKLVNSVKPHAIIYTRGFTTVKGYEQQYLEEDRRGFFTGSELEKKEFNELAHKNQNVWMMTDILERAAEEKHLELSPPLSSIKVASGPKTADKNILAKDGVSRRILLTYQNQPLFHLQEASEFNSDLLTKTNIRGSLDVFDSEQVYIDFAKPGSFSITKFENILSGKEDLKKFENKIVLIGDDLGLSAKDYVSTPYSRDATMTLTELHANMFDTLIRNSAPVQAPKWLDIFLTLVITLLTLNVILNIKPLPGIFILSGTAIGFLIISFISYWLFGLWISIVHPILAIFISYYFFIPYRLIIENRRSWEYYQKHKLLQQVEELKTNFISMMSHDLKTPIARIQGMTDIIAKDQVVLSQHQQEALDTIKASSSDLLSFINSILNYARIESQGVELHKQGRDINQLLEEVIKRHEFLAKVKQIKITTEFEPLFSITCDPDLIKQVFSNLIENAIKYSPEKSNVTIKTREESEFIKIEFIDEGPGISEDELPNVFMKFFRSKNAKSSPIKGSGLGLYLAKYFIELHQGRIFVESNTGKGSHFTVELPL